MNNPISGYNSSKKNQPLFISLAIAITAIFLISYIGFNGHDRSYLSIKYALAQQQTTISNQTNTLSGGNANQTSGTNATSATNTTTSSSSSNATSPINLSKTPVVDIVSLAKQNTFFRKEIMTADHTQVVLMSLKPGEDIGLEVHKKIDQILVFVQGSGEANITGKKIPIKEGDLAFVPAGTVHDFVNTGKTDLKLFTTYSPPNHQAGVIQKTKAEASGYVPKGAIEEEGW